MKEKLKKDLSDILFISVIFLIITPLTIIAYDKGWFHVLLKDDTNVGFSIISFLMYIYACSLIFLLLKKTAEYVSIFFFIPIAISVFICFVFAHYLF
jgi:hypothetical protein